MQETYPNTIRFQYEKLVGVSEDSGNLSAYKPTPTDSINLIMYKAGQSSAVEYIEQLLEET